MALPSHISSPLAHPSSTRTPVYALVGNPNCGKTTTVKNILMRQEPPFKRFYVIHCDGEYTEEYNDVEAFLLKDFPEPNQWPGVEKTLVVIDDVELKTLKKRQ